MAGGTTGDVDTGGDEVPEAAAPWNSKLTSTFRRVGLVAAITLVLEDPVGTGAAALTGTTVLVFAEVGVSALKLPNFGAFDPFEIGGT